LPGRGRRPAARRWPPGTAPDRAGRAPGRAGAGRPRRRAGARPPCGRTRGPAPRARSGAACAPSARSAGPARRPSRSVPARSRRSSRSPLRPPPPPGAAVGRTLGPHAASGASPHRQQAHATISQFSVDIHGHFNFQAREPFQDRYFPAMPSHEHEFPLDIIRHSPKAAVELLSVADPDPLPSYTRIRCDASEASRTSPIELHTDNLVVCEDGAKAVLAVITESQRRKEAKKKYTWPEYVTILRARLRCPVKLLVLVPNQRIADWCGAPIALGCGEIRPIPLVMSALRPLT